MAPQNAAATRRGTRAAASSAQTKPPRAAPHPRGRAARRAEPVADETETEGDPVAGIGAEGGAVAETGAEGGAVAETGAVRETETEETVTEMEAEDDAATAQPAPEMGAAAGQAERETEEMEQAETVQPEADKPGPLEKAEAQRPESTEKRLRSPPRVSFAPEHHQFQVSFQSERWPPPFFFCPVAKKKLTFLYLRFSIHYFLPSGRELMFLRFHHLSQYFFFYGLICN